MVLTMKINGEVLRTISVFPNMMTVPDCVVVGSNKLGHGHGEAKVLYFFKGRHVQLLWW